MIQSSVFERKYSCPHDAPSRTTVSFIMAAFSLLPAGLGGGGGARMLNHERPVVSSEDCRVTWGDHVTGSCHQALRQMVSADRQQIEVAQQPSTPPPPPNKHTQIAFVILPISLALAHFLSLFLSRSHKSFYSAIRSFSICFPLSLCSLHWPPPPTPTQINK